MKIVVAGASGFIGTELLRRFRNDPEIETVIGLSRSPRSSEADSKTIWRQVDLADLDSVAGALEGADTAIYLVHSMSPQARLSQGSFEDFDLQQADNFGRACRQLGIARIFYLGGILPAGENRTGTLSAHLQSRLEVERVLRRYASALTTFRAGLILGVGGSSSEMLTRLVRRLPFMAVPSWTQTESEPIDVRDVAEAIHTTLHRPDLQGQTWDLAGSERVSYTRLMRLVADELGLKRRIIPIPAISPGVSKLWVSLISGAPRALVYPLVRSLTHSMLAREDRRLLPRLGLSPKSLQESLKAIAESARAPRPPIAYVRRRDFFDRRTVRSIQRMPELTKERLARIGSLAERYFVWLPRLLLGVLDIEKSASETEIRIRFRIRFTSLTLLELTGRPGSDLTLERFRITGGLLQTADTRGFLEFRVIPGEDCGLAIVHDFVPRLPWTIYFWTQARIHLWVMRRFGRALARI